MATVELQGIFQAKNVVSEDLKKRTRPGLMMEKTETKRIDRLPREPAHYKNIVDTSVWEDRPASGSVPGS